MNKSLSMLETLKYSVTRKLLTVVFSFYVILTVSVTFFHMYVDYKTQQRIVTADLKRFENILRTGLLEALWNYNSEQVSNIINGAVKSNVIIGIEVETLLGEYLKWQIGYIADNDGSIIHKEDDKGDGVKVSGGLFSKLILHSFPLVYKDISNNEFVIGKVKLFSSHSIVFEKVKLSFSLLIMNAMIKTLFLWVMFLWAGHHYISKPLRELTDLTSNISLDKLVSSQETIPLLPQEDTQKENEVGILTVSFNKMIDRLNSTSKKLQQVQARIIGTINSMPSILVVVDQYGIVDDWNKEAEILTKIFREDIVGKKLEEAYEPYKEYVYHMKEAINSNKIYKQSKIKKEDIKGNVKYYDITIYPVVTQLYIGTVLIIDDVTKRVRIEEVMAQTEKMTSIGSLAAGVAHEINNPLGIISQSTQNVLRRLDEKVAPNQKAAEKIGLELSKVHEYFKVRKIDTFLDAICSSGERAADIVTNLIQFSKSNTTKKEMNDLVMITDKAIELAKTDIVNMAKINFQKINLVKNYENMPRVYCCASDMEQVILNVIKNSVYALTDVIEPKINIKIYSKDNKAFIEVWDNGTGIAKENISRVFEPFFTTKPIGDGRGLGLTTVYSIIFEHHNGHVEIASEEGGYTNIVISIPVKDAGAPDY